LRALAERLWLCGSASAAHPDDVKRYVGVLTHSVDDMTHQTGAQTRCLYGAMRHKGDIKCHIGDMTCYLHDEHVHPGRTTC